MTESLDESHKLHKGLIFLGSVIFMNLFFGSDFSWYLFFSVSQKTPGPSPPLSGTCQSTLPGTLKDSITSLSCSFPTVII